MLKEQQDERLWDIWLHKQTEHPDDFLKFKQASLLKQRQQTQRKQRRLTEADEQAAIAKAKAILDIKEVGATEQAGKGEEVDGADI